jgi:PBSX family phage portal protein
LKKISEWVEQSNTLNQCIAAMVTNVASNGYRVVPIAKGVEPDPDEASFLQSFIDSPNLNQSLVGIQKDKVHDFEKYGFGFIEVVRNAKGKPSLLYHAKAFYIRLLKRSDKDEAVPVTFYVKRGGQRSRVTEMRKFRKYVQVIGATKTYFKEFGDPRKMSYKTGEYETKGKKINKDELATELLHHRQYSEDVYGLPRWISQLPSILGSRESEEVNYRYFEDNTVPPMMLLVSGGKITATSYNDLNNLLNGQGIGKDRQNQVLLIEAVPETTSLDDKGNVQIKVEKLTSERPSDGLFKEYDDSNMAKIRSSFRLPPVLIGLSQDVNFATANTSTYVAETQVFVPERKAHDEMFNKGFVNHPSGLNLSTVKLETRGPEVTNPEQIVKTLTATNVMGAVTPRSAIDVINETMQLSLPALPKKGEEGWEEWMDKPISLSQRIVVAESRQQQTGEGDETNESSSGKDGSVKGIEEEGDIGVGSLAVEHGQE